MIHDPATFEVEARHRILNEIPLPMQVYSARSRESFGQSTRLERGRPTGKIVLSGF